MGWYTWDPIRAEKNSWLALVSIAATGVSRFRLLASR
jgi:hypothetical protein